MWPNYAAGVGTGRNRRLSKDKDGRAAVVRSGSRRRKESSRRNDSNALNAMAHSVQSLPHAEEDSEIEELPALPPSRPSSASPMLSPNISGEKVGSNTVLYRLALPPITPAALQPYLEEETQLGEQIPHEGLASPCTSEPHTDPSRSNSRVPDLPTNWDSKLSDQLLKTGETMSPSRSSDSVSTEPPSQQRYLSTYSQSRPKSTQSQSSPTSYPLMPVAIPTQKHNLAQSMIGPYYIPHNGGRNQACEPHILPQWPQGGNTTLEWQHQLSQQSMSSFSEKLPPFPEPQPSVVPPRLTVYTYEETAIEELAFRIRKVASDIEALRGYSREILCNLDNQAWNVRELERRTDDLRRNSNTRFEEERTALMQQGAIERSALQNKIRSLENQVREKEKSDLLENQSLRAQLHTATQEVLHLKKVLRFEAQSRTSSSDQSCELLSYLQPDEAGDSKYCTPEPARNMSSR